MEINKIYAENCLDTMARMHDGFVDLTVTSPPYDNLRDYNGYVFDFEAIAKELYRVTKDGGVVVWVVGDQTVNGSETGTSFRQALFFMECGFNLHDTMIYEKTAAFPDVVRYYQEFEYMFVFSKGKPFAINLLRSKKTKSSIVRGGSVSKGERQIDGSIKHLSESAKKRMKQAGKDDTRVMGNVWKIKAGFNLSTKDKLAFSHPAIFPERLAANHIYSWSNEGDLVYDPFTGSGTTPKMAHLANRNWVGSEISQENVDLANKRIDPYLRQQRLF